MDFLLVALQAAPGAPATLITDPILSTLTFSAIVVWLLEQLKKWDKFPLLSADTALWAQRAWGVIAAFISAVGIGWSFDAVTGTLQVTGLLFPSLTAALWTTIQAFVVQQLIYHGVVKPPLGTVEARIAANP